jgi:hypothetical protein
VTSGLGAGEAQGFRSGPSLWRLHRRSAMLTTLPEELAAGSAVPSTSVARRLKAKGAPIQIGGLSAPYFFSDNAHYRYSALAAHSLSDSTMSPVSRPPEAPDTSGASCLSSPVDTVEGLRLHRSRCRTRPQGPYQSAHLQGRFPEVWSERGLQPGALPPPGSGGAGARNAVTRVPPRQTKCKASLRCLSFATRARVHRSEGKTGVDRTHSVSIGGRTAGPVPVLQAPPTTAAKHH